MFGLIGCALIVAWLLGFIVFHVAGGLIHLLLILGMISLVWRVVQGKRTA